MVRINYNNGNVSTVKTFGQQQAVCSVDLSEQDPDLYNYKGDVVIRKFPYGESSKLSGAKGVADVFAPDPNDPYFQTGGIV